TQLAGLEHRIEGGGPSQSAQLEIILAEGGKMSPPPVQRVDKIVAQRKDRPHGFRVRIEVIENAVFLRNQAADGLRDRALEKDSKGVTDFVFSARPLYTEGEDLFKLVKDKMGDLGRLLAAVQAKPKTASGIIGKVNAKLVPEYFHPDLDM